MGSDTRDWAGGSLKRSFGYAFGKIMICFVTGIVMLMTIPASAQVDNCCGVDRQCASADDWNAGYYAYQNGQCAAPSPQQTSSTSQPQPQPASTDSEDIDNCCFVDQQCATDEEWINGYNAYQNNQCAAPSQQRQSSSSSAQTGSSEDSNNCCFFGWQCDTDDEWKNGYWAYQANSQCPAPSQTQQQGRRQGHNGNQQGSSSEEGQHPISTTYDPETRVTVHTYEDGTEIITRPATPDEYCEALKRLEMTLPPECE